MLEKNREMCDQTELDQLQHDYSLLQLEYAELKKEYHLLLVSLLCFID